MLVRRVCLSNEPDRSKVCERYCAIDKLRLCQLCLVSHLSSLNSVHLRLEHRSMNIVLRSCELQSYLESLDRILHPCLNWRLAQS